MMTVKVASLLIWASCLISTILAENAPIVKLEQGELNGVTTKTRNGDDYYAYWGIPYAKPPKRFQSPEPPEVPGWKGVRDATKAAPFCVHLDFFTRAVDGVEDCLVANVFTKSVDAKGKLKPVIVYIHGGGFMFSSGDAYGADYFLDEPVVLVTFNYRLTSFGFLNADYLDKGRSSKSEVATGNMGLKDQALALKWVQKNIKKFGGDPEQVTIFGTSAGGASVSYHLLSPLSKGLFKNAIAASGSFLNSWALIENPEYYAKELGKALNCPTSDSKALVQCLLKKDAKEIAEKSYLAPIPGWTRDPILPFAPTIEKPNEKTEVFLSQHPATLFRKGKFQKVNYMTGVTKHEGLLLHAAHILANPDLAKKLNEDWNKIAPMAFTFAGKIPESKWDEASEEIREFYFGSKDAAVEEHPEKLEQVYSDRWFLHGTRKTVLRMAKEAPVYLYVFAYAGEKTGFQNLYPQQDYTGKVFHADDILYGFNGRVLGFNLNPDNTDSIEFSKKYVKLIASFATKGAPDASILDSSVKWPKVSEEQANGKKSLEWFHLENKPSLENDSLILSRMKFWDNLFQKYGELGQETREEL